MLYGLLLRFISLIFLVYNVSAATTQPRSILERGIADGVFTTCFKGVVKNGCNSVLDTIWNDGRIKTFTTEHQFYTGQSNCKLTWWTDSGVVLLGANQKHTLQNALQQIDDACTASGLSLVYNSENNGEGAFVGRLFGNEYVVLKAQIGAGNAVDPVKPVRTYVGDPVYQYPQNFTGNPVYQYPQNFTGSPVYQYPQNFTGNPVYQYPQNFTGSPVYQYPQNSTGDPVYQYPKTQTGNPVYQYSSYNKTQYDINKNSNSSYTQNSSYSKYESSKSSKLKYYNENSETTSVTA
ncbi:hypothetical protein BY996DRAFT_571871 [Phakopsora pachyrhizi]|nr:hypothetical protein BY996DRAFT_571871 [Phakopsora pachyrhizi]